jgi:peptidoglycan hydrolase-like protein with peptidoglycan-binding domain
MSSTAVKALQVALAKVGCYSGPVDGTIGPQTTRAVTAFQSAAGLAADGVYGSQTRSKLLTAAAAGTKVCGATVPTSTTSTTSAATSLSAPCTSAAVAAALPSSDKVISFQCAGGWAAGSFSNGVYDAAYLLQSSSGKWVRITAVSVCTSGSIPTAILDVSPCKVS